MLSLNASIGYHLGGSHAKEEDPIVQSLFPRKKDEYDPLEVQHFKYYLFSI
jgi:hypothetical protein